MGNRAGRHEPPVARVRTGRDSPGREWETGWDGPEQETGWDGPEEEWEEGWDDPEREWEEGWDSPEGKWKTGRDRQAAAGYGNNRRKRERKRSGSRSAGAGVRHAAVSVLLTAVVLVSVGAVGFLVLQIVGKNRLYGSVSSEELVVLDSRGEPVYSTDERLTESCRELRDGGSLAGRSRKVKLGGVSDYMISAGQSDVLGWEYYICYDMNRGQYAGAKLSGVILLSILIIVATCFFMTSYTIYRPVGRLVQGVSEVEQKIDGNELQFLASRFADMKNDRQVLEAMMYQQKEKLLELFELRLIRGEVRTEDEWSEYFEGLHLRRCKYFASAVVVLNLRDESETQSNVNEDAICLKLVEALPAELKEMTWMPIVYNACAIFGLFGEDDEAVLLDADGRCGGYNLQWAWSTGNP